MCDSCRIAASKAEVKAQIAEGGRGLDDRVDEERQHRRVVRQHADVTLGRAGDDHLRLTRPHQPVGGDQLNVTSLMGGSPLHNLLYERIEKGFIVAGTSAAFGCARTAPAPPRRIRSTG